MPDFKAQYLTDAEGNKTGVLLSLEEYEAMLADLEELEAIRAYDKAKASGDEAVPFEDAMAEIERNH
jgi:PHD/YefM family antitoxin component YafN of YafNO toxin-antitoxin module